MQAPLQRKQLKVFFSYSRDDLAVADALTEALEAQGIDVLLDRRDLPYGEEWQRELGNLIRAADAVVWLVSPRSVKSRWCNWELGETQRLHKRLVPLLIEKVPSADMPDAIGKIQFLPGWSTFSIDKHFDLLRDTLQTDRPWLKEHTRLADLAHEWIARGRRSAFLISGDALRDAQTWLDSRPDSSLAVSEQILEFMLASRKASTQGWFWLFAGPALIALAGLIAYVAVMTLLTSSEEDMNIILGDMDNTQNANGYRMSLFACRTRCILLRFPNTCAALTYSPESGTCYPKYEAPSAFRPKRFDKDPANSEIMPFQARPGVTALMPLESIGLLGEPVETARVREVTGAGGLQLTPSRSPSRLYWQLPNHAACQKLCGDLTRDCRAFVFTAGAPNRCELLRSVTGVMRETTSGEVVVSDLINSGCRVRADCDVDFTPLEPATRP